MKYILILEVFIFGIKATFFWRILLLLTCWRVKKAAIDVVKVTQGFTLSNPIMGVSMQIALILSRGGPHFCWQYTCCKRNYIKVLLLPTEKLVRREKSEKSHTHVSLNVPCGVIFREDWKTYPFDGKLCSFSTFTCLLLRITQQLTSKKGAVSGDATMGWGSFHAILVTLI